MELYESNMNWIEIVEKMKSLRVSGFIVDLGKAITSVKVEDDKVVFFGTGSIGTLTNEKSGVGLELKLHWTVKLIVAFYLGMAMMFLFQSDVTLNGDPSPTILEKLAFVLVFIVAGWISYYIMFSRTHHSLKRHLEKELELKKPHTTKPRAN